MKRKMVYIIPSLVAGLIIGGLTLPGVSANTTNSVPSGHHNQSVNNHNSSVTDEKNMLNDCTTSGHHLNSNQNHHTNQF